jgi:hypothetical protein
VLVKNIERNECSNNIIAMNVALSDFDGESYFVESSMGGHFGSGNQIVKVRTLDSVVNQLNATPSMAKLDVEGAEFSVLKGGLNALTHYHPKLLIEVHTTADFKLFDFLTSLGYSFSLVEDEGELLSLGEEEIKRKCIERRSTKYGTRMNQHVYCEKCDAK